MNDAQLLERFTSAYAALEAPAPSVALVARMDAGGVDGDESRDFVVPFAVPSRPSRRTRTRSLVAALVACFVVLSGLAAAGALPDPLQRRVSSVVSHLGIDLPRPEPAPGVHDTPGVHNSPAGIVPTPSGEKPVAHTGAGRTAGDAPAGSPVTTTPGDLLGGASGGANGVTGTTDVPLPSVGGGSGLPPVTLRPSPVPQLSLPPIQLPGLPPITLPPVPLTVPTLPGF